MASPSRKKSWQTSRERVSVLADLAIRKETVVRKLTELREAHELTQERAAAKVGVTVRQWQRWESGKSVPYARNISAIAERFEINEGEFFDPPEERAPAAAEPPAATTAERLAAIEDRLARMEDLLVGGVDRLDKLEGMMLDGLDKLERALNQRAAAHAGEIVAGIVDAYETGKIPTAQPRSGRTRAAKTAPKTTRAA